LIRFLANVSFPLLGLGRNKEEYLAFLKAHDVKFDEEYLWD
jgi:hypothetical protein